MLALALPSLSLPGLFPVSERVTGLSGTLTHAPLVAASKGEPGNINVGDRNRDEILALFADELTVGNVFAKTLANSPAYDVSKSGMVAIDLERHSTSFPSLFLISVTSIPDMKASAFEREGTSSPPERPGLVLTSLGPDRPGLVNRLAAFVKRHDGNIEDTRMAKLGGEFAVIMLVSGQASNLDSLMSGLAEVESETGLICFAKRTEGGQAFEARRLVRLKVSALDRPGIVQAVTEVLADKSVNVASLSSRLVPAPLTGASLFELEADLQIPDAVPFAALEGELNALCEREDLDFTLSEGHA